jgi:flagellar hook-associated protein 1 FlgK
MTLIGLNTGLKALLSARYALDTVGHNIANANTPGYSRQRVQLGAALPVQLGRLLIGSGVDAGSVQRSVDELLGRRIQGQRSLASSLAVQRGGLSDIEALLGEPGEGGLADLLEGFFDNVSQLATGPSDPILRTGVVEATQALGDRFRSFASDLERLGADARADVGARLDEVNALADEIAALNREIGATESVGVPANDLRDRRDAALGRLSELVDVTAVDGPNGSLRVLVTGNILVGSARANHLSLDQGDPAELRVRIEGADGFVAVQGGEIGGLLRLGEELAPDYRGRLDQLARQFILAVNRVHSTGVPTGGGFQSLTGTAELADFDGDGRVEDELLAKAGLPFEITSGALYVNVVERSTGALEKHRIDVDATHTSVQGFLDALNDVPGLSATLDARGRLRVAADQGFAFDFSRRIDADPDPEGLFGGARPTFATGAAGPFALADGDTLTLAVQSGGPPASVALTFSAADFADISQATAEELADVINADPQAQASGVRASAVEGRLFLQSLSTGTGATLTLTGGTAVGALGLGAFTGVPVTGQANAVDVRLGGTYTGASDQRYVLRPLGDGTIGTTPGLQVEVFDQGGQRVALLDVGAGYVPGTELEIAHGVRARFGLGELSATHGDLLAFEAVADADSTDALVALGLNGMLEGSGASDIALRAELADDPALLSVSLSGEEGDGSLLVDLLELEHAVDEGLGGVDLGRFFGDLVGEVGFEAGRTESALASSAAVLESLETRQQSISGVNVDEELVDLVAYEQSFAAAAQYLSVVNQLGEEILSLL